MISDSGIIAFHFLQNHLASGITSELKQLRQFFQTGAFRWQIDTAGQNLHCQKEGFSLIRLGGKGALIIASARFNSFSASAQSNSTNSTFKSSSSLFTAI